MFFRYFWWKSQVITMYNMFKNSHFFHNQWLSYKTEDQFQISYILVLCDESVGTLVNSINTVNFWCFADIFLIKILGTYNV